MEKVNRWIFYILGMVVLAAGITLNTKTGLGVSPIISVAYCVSQIFELNFGDMTFVLYGIFCGGAAVSPGAAGSGWPHCCNFP